MKISCPQCDTEFNLENAESFLTCPECKNSLFIDLDDVIAVYTFKSAIEPHLIGTCLKKNFEKMGFDEDFYIVYSVPVYIPFWQLEGMEKLKRGCSRFPVDDVNLLSTNRKFFDPNRLDFRIEVLDIDTQPAASQKRILYYYPFFRLDIEFREEKYRFFVDAVTGAVFGDSIAFISGKHINRMFPLFLLFFVVFLAVNYFFNQLFVSISINVLLIFVFFQVSLHVFDKQGSNK